MLCRIAIQARNATSMGKLAAPQFRGSLVPAKRFFANYNWQRVSSTKPWNKPLRDTVPKAEPARASVGFTLEKLPQTIVGSVAILGCMVFMSPMGVVTGFNMYEGVSGKKNQQVDGSNSSSYSRRPTNVCIETEGKSAAGNAAGRKFNPRAMHPYMNGLTVGHENEFNRKNSSNFA